jgi:pimeloyl-ACP methyl ester carboxylesterase
MISCFGARPAIAARRGDGVRPELVAPLKQSRVQAQPGATSSRPLGEPDDNAGDIVVLLHSSASSSRQWQGVMAMLRGSYRLLAPDFHGYGETPAWRGPSAFSLSDEVALIETALRGYQAPVHLVGHSYGGAVALRYALQYPHKLRSLLLIEPVAFHLLRNAGQPDSDHRFFHEVDAVAQQVSQGLAQGDHHAAMTAFVDYWNGAGTWARTPPEVRDRLSRQAAKVALDFQATQTEAADQAAYADITVPSLIIRGSHSPRPVQRIAELIAGALPASRLITLEGGHMLPITHPEQIGSLIQGHLAATSVPI